MANICINKLIIEGKGVDKFMKYAKGIYPKYRDEKGKAFRSDLCLHKFIPIPKDVLDSGYNDVGYNWQVENWGVKWVPAYVEVFKDGKDCISYEFETPWSPLKEDVIIKMSNKFSGLRFTYLYGEPGMDYSGRLVVKNGAIISQKEGEYGLYYGEDLLF